MTNDMSQVIVPKSDQINADDLIAGPMTITVAGVSISGGTEQPVSIGIVGNQKVFRPCKSMSRVLVQAWGPDANNYKGKSMTLYRDPKVKWGGMEVGGIRISHMSDIENDMTLMLTASKQARAPHKVKRLEATKPRETNPATLKAATEAAEKGKEAFGVWWKAATPEQRDDANTILDDLKAATAKADAPVNDDTPRDDEPPM